jgi:hypothetical protein
MFPIARTIAAFAIALSGAACSKGSAQTAEERERALLKTLIGSESGRPIMGQFALKKEDAAKVNAAFRKSSRAAFELASRLAVQKWVYEDRWCNDAVRQIVLFGLGDEKATTMTADDLKSKLMDKILDRHYLMYKERTPEGCERALRRLHEAKSFARKAGLVHMHFGY